MKRCGLAGELPPDVASLLELIDEVYASHDEDRAMAERSMEICSKELTERNLELTERNRQVQAAHGELQAMHRDLRQMAEQLEQRVTERTAELRAAEEDYRTIFEGATVGIFRTTPDGRVIKCNPAFAAIYGYGSPQELMSQVYDLKRQVYVEGQTRDRWVAQIEAHGRVTDFAARMYRKDRSIIWVSLTGRAVRGPDGAIVYLEGFLTDITAHKQAEDRLRESEERYALAMRGANDGIWDWDLTQGLIYYSPRWKQMLGACENQIGTLPEEWFSRIHPADLTAVHQAIAAHRDGDTPHFEIEHRVRHADGEYRWMHTRALAIRDESGRATRMAGSQTDITARKLAEEQLVRDALHDSLTGLPNRVLMLDRLERSITRCTRDRQHAFAVLFLDLDRFKVINDSLGHVVGDQLLVQFAQRLSACVRPTDTVARLGGDEFTILLEDPKDSDDALAVAQRILDALRRPIALDNQEIFVSTSIGIALSHTGYQRPQDVLRDADTAMYRAKSQGKSQAQVFDQSMHARAVKQLQIENDLRRAIDRDELVLHYQPIFRIGSSKLRAFEALVRWKHPERGLIPPMDFIPIAEETGLILPMGKWVLNAACQQAAHWLALFPDRPIDMNINLSARQFSQNDLVEQVTAALRKSGLPAKHLTLEITESVVMEKPEAAILMLQSLKDLGVQLNIDDFGTGYSSLAYLQRFPVDTMKIDRSFISRMTEGPENAEIVRTIIALAHNLNLHVTAEGIETTEQLAQLDKLECENAQGYLFSRPLDAAAAGELLKKAQVFNQAA
jgi:diguanylate cyclase (GGDEF)-like protein/PAS domain S-box-containing protein